MNKDEQEETSGRLNSSTHGKKSTESGQAIDVRNRQDEKNTLKTDPLYQFLKPLHHLPRGKNTWDPQIIKKWWFWPVSALFLIILFYVYPYIWDFFAS
jgi:hypothetical protein